MPLSLTFRAVLVLTAASLLFCPLLVAGAACGTYGTLRRPHLVNQYEVPGNSKIGLVTGCQRACLDEGERCKGFAVNMSNKRCRTYSDIMEKQGEAISKSFDTLHYDISCFYDRSNSSSTQIAHHLANSNDAYICMPSTDQAVYNPSFETGVWTGYAHGWSLRGSTKENVPRRSAIGHAMDGSTNM